MIDLNALYMVRGVAVNDIDAGLDQTVRELDLFPLDFKPPVSSPMYGEDNNVSFFFYGPDSFPDAPDSLSGEIGQEIDPCPVFRRPPVIGVTVWSPLAGGLLTGKYNAPTQEPKRWTHESPMSAAYVNDRNLKIAQAAIDIASRINRSPSQVAINWIRQKKDQGNLIPIIAGRNVDQFRDDMNCLNFELSPEHMKRLDQASAISHGFPSDFLASEFVQKLIHGETRQLLEVEMPLAA